jgi:hypothetical protein
MLRRNLRHTPRFVTISAALRASSSSRDAEKRAEEAREAELRARFAGGGTQPASGGGFFDNLRATAAQAQQQGAPNFSNQSKIMGYFRNADGSETRFMVGVMLFCTLYSFWMWYNLRLDTSKHVAAGGLPGWAVSSDAYAGWAALRYLVPYSEQRRVFDDFRTYKMTTPNASMGQFLMQRYPHLVSGARTTPGEFLASLAAVHAHSASRDWVGPLFRGAGGGDIASKVDRLMDSMRTTHAHALMLGPPPPPVQGQSPMATFNPFAGGAAPMVMQGQGGQPVSLQDIVAKAQELKAQQGGEVGGPVEGQPQVRFVPLGGQPVIMQPGGNHTVPGAHASAPFGTPPPTAATPSS